ncbi:MAG: hypothetical protein Q8P51_07135 [Ignavibacteria bacterium]|nr:hypothetical protein [Ignavibacteria bacterium]
MRFSTSIRNFQLVCFLAFALLSQQALAQGEAQQHGRSRWWVNVSVNNTGELGVNLKKASLWVLRSSYVGNLGVPGKTSATGSPSWDIGFLLGDEWNNDWGSVSASAGVAMTVVKTEYTGGIPFEAHTVVTPLSFVGFGVGFLGNLNLKGSFSQIVFTLRFGSL